MKRLIKGFIASLSGLFLLATPVIAAHYIFLGNAVVLHEAEVPGDHGSNAAQFISDPNYVGFGAIDVTPKRTITIGQLEELSSDFYVYEGDCGLTPPRFRLRLGHEESGRWRPTDTYLYADLYLQSECLPVSGTWLPSGDLTDTSTALWYSVNVDESNPLGPYTFNERPDFGDNVFVQEILLIADNGDETNPQVVLVDNVNVNGVVQLFDTPSSLCRDGGWDSLGFISRQECMKYFTDLGKDIGKP